MSFLDEFGYRQLLDYKWHWLKRSATECPHLWLTGGNNYPSWNQWSTVIADDEDGIGISLEYRECVRCESQQIRVPPS